MNVAGAALVDMEVDDAVIQEILRVVTLSLSPAALGGFLKTTVEPYVQNRARVRFLTEGDDAVGGSWAPLKDVTAEWREFYGFPPYRPINRRTGELEEYITESSGDISWEPMGARMTYPGSPPDNVWLEKKVRTAQKGGPGTVARPVLAWAIVDLEFVLRMLSNFVVQAALQKARVL